MMQIDKIMRDLKNTIINDYISCRTAFIMIRLCYANIYNTDMKSFGLE